MRGGANLEMIMLDLHLGCVGILMLAGAALGQVSPLGPFAGPYTEGFETQPADPSTLYTCLPGRIFNGTADFCDPTSGSAMIPGFLSLFCQAVPRQGARYAVSLIDPVEISFDAPVSRFGGYFATVGGLDGAVVTFFDAAGPIGTADLTTNQCDWTWNGWESTSSFTRVRIVGNTPFAEGGYIHMDDLEYRAGGAVCYPNCDGSTISPVLNVSDFACFLNRFAAADSYANCDGSTTVPVLNVADFSCFLNAFAAGCS